LGLCLIGAVLIPAWVVNVLVVVIALGMVIFVHELGHFLVAKLCGVKCEKFYLGFDIFGGKLCKFTWGETEYGVGILPLGGYVKMLGQEDNPARLREELERAQAAQGGETSNPGEDEATADAATSDQPQGEAIDVEAARQALFDPRSYLAQSVPKRMAIISAGVIMNVLFALVMAVIAFGLGVHQVESSVGAVVPGDAAWQLNIKVGDHIEAIGGEPIHRFTDLKAAVSLGDNLDQGLTLTVRRPGQHNPFEVTAVPDRMGLAPTIGVGLPWATRLRHDQPVVPGSSAASATPSLESGDQIVGIDGEPVESYAEIFRQLARKPDKTLHLTVRRKAKPEAPEQSGSDGEEITVRVDPRPMLRVGLVMALGPIAAVQQDSPAAHAGILAGDRLLQVDGHQPGDPMTLPDRLRRRAQENPEVTLTIARLGRPKPMVVAVRLRPADSFDSLVTSGSPVSVPSLGIAYRVLNRVERVVEDSPAAKAGVQPGAVLLSATLIPPDKKTIESQGMEGFVQETLAADLGEDELDWPYVFSALESDTLPGTLVELKLADGREIVLRPVPADDWFNPDRGFLFDLKFFIEQARTPGESLRLGFEETIDSLTMVFRTIQKLSTRQVSPRLLRGPWTIAKYAYYSAEEGVSALLIFLCLISANLAVLNFLPIPVLDGGHMVFLVYEGIRGKPPSENVQVALSYLGLAFILALMLWVIGIDVGLIPGQ